MKGLVTIQVLPCENLVEFFCGKRCTDTAFACVLTLLSEILFTSKLYLTAALHGSVMQVVVDDTTFLDTEVAKVLSRISPKAAIEKFGQPGTPATKQKIQDHMKILQQSIVRLCKKFLKSLRDKIYCFPVSLKWTVWQLYEGMITKLKLPIANSKAIVGHVLMSYFICPAIIKPEPYGINSDADISETARHNLGQIASVLRSLALVECGLKDERFKGILECFDKGTITSFVDAVLHGADKINIFEDDGNPQVVNKCSLFMTEKNVKTIIACLKLFQKDVSKKTVKSDVDELLAMLPPPPRRWTKTTPLPRNALSLPPDMMCNIGNDSPVAPPRHNRQKKTKSLAMGSELDATSMTSSPIKPAQNNEQVENEEELAAIKSDLISMLTEEESVLAVPLGNENDQQPGMLSEEKVLGIEQEAPPSATFDLEQTDEDRRRRASSMMLAALTDQISLDKDQALSSSPSNSDSSAEGGISSKKDTQEPLLIDISSPSASVSNVNDVAKVETIRNPLLDLEDGQTSPTPALPAKKYQQNQLTLMQDEPLINIDNDVFVSPNLAVDTSFSFSNEKAKNDYNTNRYSKISLIGGQGGINDILQSAAVPSPNSIHEPTTLSPLDPFGKTDPWGLNRQSISAPSPTNTNDSQNSSNNPFDDSFSEQNNQNAPTEQNYEQYKSTIQREQKAAERTASINSSGPNNEEEEERETVGELEDFDNKRMRKRSWLKDKIMNVNAVRQSRLGTAFSNLRNNQGALIKAGSAEEAADALAKRMVQQRELQKDAGEDIMEKYRNISTIPRNQQPPQEESVFGTSPSSRSVVPQEDTKFDDEFKFGDAKRKLRTVLCSSDAGTLPSTVSSFDQLLLTMLQAKLAEAINLQDRSLVAQLHETLRSIKQLPSGSCQKLIEELEEDYKKRAPYISYLIKSRQGLLSTISHLEDITKKVQRDMVICAQYFNTLSVRLFLETHDQKREVFQFRQKFATTKMLDEKCALLNDFLEHLHNKMLKDTTWMYCTDSQLESVQVATERAIISRIYKEAFYPNGLTDIENDRLFHEHIARLSKVITLNHSALQIPKMFQKEAPWPSAQTELLMINAYKTAVDKLRCIHRCCVTIMNLLSMATDNAQGADDFVPVMVFVVIKANPPNLLSTKQYVNTFYETRLSGEEYYCWMQFCAAVEFIKTLKGELINGSS